MNFFGISEEDEGSTYESPAKTEQLLRFFHAEELKIPTEEVNNISFERVRHIPTRKENFMFHRQRANPRPIIAKFSYYKQKERMWRYVKNLKGTKYGIANDYPKEIDNIRKAIYPHLKEAKRDKRKAYFNVDRLIIDGEVYWGEETENLPYYASILTPPIY